MSESHKPFSSYARVLLAGALLFAFACSTDSPTEPRQDPQPPGGQPSGAFSVTISASASQLALGSNEAVTITINVRQTSNNQPPPDGTTAVVRTTLGNFGSVGSGVQEGTVTLTGGLAQVLLFAGDTAGTATISAQVENAIARTNVTFTGSATFFLQAISPTIGSPNGGDVVRITGGGFIEPVRVTFNSIPAQVLTVGPTAIRVRTPALDLPVGSSQLVSVNVTVGLNTELQKSDSLPNSFTYTRGGTATAPVIFSVTPNSGPNEGGTRVVIEGDGFEAPVQVLFGSGSTGSFSGIEAVVESVTRTRIVAISPTATGFGQGNQNALVNVLVRNRNSGDATVFTNGFRYGVDVLITSIGPGEGPLTGGQLVTLFGQGFDEPVAVSLAGYAQSIVSVTGTEIIVRTVAIQPNGCSDVSGASSVTNVETGDSATGPDYTYRVTSSRPRVQRVSPNTGTGGGTSTITGSNFGSSTEVLFDIGDGLRGSIQSFTPTSLTVTVPTPQASDFGTEACDDNNDGTEGERYIATVADLIVTDNFTTCESTFEGGFTFTPSDTSCRNDIGPVEPVEAPVADFSFQALNAASNILQFIDESTGDITSWTWSFGDGTLGANAQNPSHDFPDGPGSYSVTLKVTGPGGSDTTVQVVTFPLP